MPAGNPVEYNATLVIEVLAAAATALEPDGLDTGADAALHEIAWTHDHLSTSLSLVGRIDLAILASRRAVRARRRLADLDGGEQPTLVGSLTNLSVHLSSVARHEESLDAATEAVAICRPLVKWHGATYHDALATTLVNLSVSLNAVGRSDEALEATAEAVELRRALPADAPGRPAGLATALHNMAVDLALGGRDAEALATVEEAVGIRRRLAEDDPDAFRPDLAESLNNLSVRLGAMGRQTDALLAVQEAVAICRALVADDPDRFLPDLATSLVNLAADLNATGSSAAESLAATAEAVRIRRQLAQLQPDATAADLATALQNMAIDLAAMERPEQAVAAVEEAVGLRRSLAERHFDRHGPDLARSLRTLAARLTPIGRMADSVTAAQEAVDIFRSLARTRRDAVLPELASALDSLATRLRAVRRHPEALVAREEAVLLYRGLAEAAPNLHRRRLASALDKLSLDLARARRQPEALAAAEEAVSVHRSLGEEADRGGSDGLVGSLRTLVLRLRELDRPAAALAAAEEVLALRRARADADPGRELPHLVSAVDDLAWALAATGRVTLAAALFTGLLQQHSADHWATGTILLGRAWWHADRADVAAAVHDARVALDHLQTDPGRLREARSLLQTLRHADPERFDEIWNELDGDQPRWLRHLRYEDARRAVIRAWYARPSLEEHEAFLEQNAAALLTDEALATLDRLIDDNPDDAGLQAFRDIIDVAREHGVAAAYARYRVRLWRDAVRDVLAAWLGAPTEEELRQQLDAEHVLLLRDEAQVQAESWLAVDPGRPDRLWRTGLLTLCRLDGVDPAFAMLNMTDTAPRPASRTRPSEHRPRDLAVARLRSGREPDNPDTAFVHAELALLAGRDDEADAAIARCAEYSTSWNRRYRARLLTDWMEQCPELEAGWARLRSTIAAYARDARR